MATHVPGQEPEPGRVGVSLNDYVTPEEAAAKMLHHLGLAACYFEATDEDLMLLLQKVAVEFPLIGDGEYKSPERLAAEAFVIRIHHAYQHLDEELGGERPTLMVP